MSRLRGDGPAGEKGTRGGDGAIACSRQGEVEDDHDVHHSRMGAAQATGFGLGTFDEEQTFLDARNGEQPRLEIRVDRPSARKVAAVVVRIGIKTDHLGVSGQGGGVRGRKWAPARRLTALVDVFLLSQVAESRWRVNSVDTVQGNFRASLRERTRDQATDGNEYHV